MSGNQPHSPRPAVPTATWLGMAALFLALTWNLLGPFFETWDAYGIQDWDAHMAYRAMARLSLLHFGEGPWWNPYLCGGFPNWGYVEGATNVVSPFAPFHLLFPVNVAVRLEVVGSTLVALVASSLLASQSIRRPSLWALVSVVWALNARWAMQATVGHTWHLQYAWLPLALFCFGKALRHGQASWAVASGGVLALMVYTGGIYPLPHTVLLLGLQTCWVAGTQKSTRPLMLLLITGASAVGLAAPKLFPVLELSGRHPRFIASEESITLPDLWVLLTTRAQDFGHPPLRLPSWGWHEYGIYVGVLPVVLMALSLVLAPRRGTPLFKVLGLLCVTLGMGAFAWWSPWALLHQLPLFSSQHVPSRFLFPGLLLLMVSAGAFLDGLLHNVRWRWLEPVLFLAVAAVGWDITSVGAQWTPRAFSLRANPLKPSPVFQHLVKNPHGYTWPQGGPQAHVYPSSLLAMEGNVGTLKCYGVPDLQPGAVAADTPGHVGEAYVLEGSGTARVTEWTPNTAVVEYRDASPGALLVYNMNHDPGWQVDGAPALDHAGAVASRLQNAQGAVTFRYVPPGLHAGVATWMVTLLVLVGWCGWVGVGGSGHGVPVRWLEVTHRGAKHGLATPVSGNAAKWLVTGAAGRRCHRKRAMLKLGWVHRCRGRRRRAGAWVALPSADFARSRT